MLSPTATPVHTLSLALVFAATTVVGSGSDGGETASRSYSEVRRADVVTAASGNLPGPARSGLALLEQSGRALQTMAFTPQGEYVIVAANRPLFSPGFPSGPREQLNDYAGVKQIDVVAFSRTGQWLIIAEDWLRRYNIPSAANSQIRSLQSAGKRIEAFAFSSVDTNGWILVADGRAYSGGRLPNGLSEAVTAARLAKRPIHDVAISFTGQWTLVADDWFVTDGVPSALHSNMDRFRTYDGRRIDHVVLGHVLGGSTVWAMVSNAIETVGSDRMSRIENSLTGSNQSVYQRMRDHNVTGLSLAIVENNRVTWRRSYGLRASSDKESYVYPTTIFEAASISKPVAAFGALQLANQGKIDMLNTPIIEEIVTSLDTRSSGSSRRRGNNATGPQVGQDFLRQFASEDEINLNLLLSHCAGVLHPPQVSNPTCCTGAQQFNPGDRLPSMTQMLTGQDPASTNKRPVQTTSLDPGNMYVYSGANYLVTQAVIDHYSDRGFDHHMREIFRDLQMNSTTYDTPAPSYTTDRYARGHSNRRIARVRAYPNKAAAALSTTADDLARFAIMLNQNGTYNGRRLMTAPFVQALAGQNTFANQQCSNRNSPNPTRGIMGLGLMNNQNGTWHHGGVHAGYRAWIHARPGNMFAIVVLASGAPGDVSSFAAELYSAVRQVYNFPSGAFPR